MPGLSFLNALFLAGLAAAALPILIHLFSKRPARFIAFPSLEYLREISLKRVRRMQLRQWLLLALRVAILALFALAMGRPVLQGGAGRMTRGSSTIAILLDTSYSMGAQLPAAPNSGPAETPSVFALAQRRAGDVLDLLSEGDKGYLILAGRPLAIPFQTAVANVGLLRQEVARAVPGSGRADVPAALERAVELVRAAHTLNKEIFIISDFQQVDLEEWARGGARGTGSPVAALSVLRGLGATDAKADSNGVGVAELPDGVRVYLVPVRDAAIENLSLSRGRLERSGGVSGRGHVLVNVSNHSDEPIEGRVLRAVAVGSTGGSDLGRANLDLPARGERETDLSLERELDLPELELRLGDDYLDADNHFYLVTGATGSPRVLLVGGGPSGGAVGASTGGDSDFIAAALDPAGNGEFFQVRRAGVESLSDPAGWEAEVVVLANVGRLSETAVENLVRFRARGGGIFISLGDRVDARYYNSGLLSRLSSLELLNLLQDPGEGTFRSFRPTVLPHPIFAGFPVTPGEDLSSARFRKVMECRVGPGARVLGEWSGRLPALVEEDGLLLFTSSLDGEWNDFPTSASFLPMLHQALRYLANRAGNEHGPSLVGAPLETTVEAASVATPLYSVAPSGSRSAVAATPNEDRLRLRSEPTTEAGIHRFVDESGREVSAFAVNVDPKEGDLQVAPKELLTRGFGHAAQILPVGERVTRELLEGRYGRELWRPILVLVLLLLAIESLLARGKILA